MWERANDAQHALNGELSRSLADAVLYSENIGDALVNSFARAGAALLESGIHDLLSGKNGGGLFGDIASGIGSLFGGPRANGGGVSAGRMSQIGRASCRERVCMYVYISGVACTIKKKQKQY